MMTEAEDTTVIEGETVEAQTEGRKITVSEFLGTADENEQVKIISRLAERTDIVVMVQFNMGNRGLIFSVSGAKLSYDQIADLLATAAKEAAKQAALETERNKKTG